MKIKSIHLYRLRNEAHYQLMIFFVRLLDKYPEVKYRIATELPAFDALLAKEDAAVDFMTKSDLTKLIAQADRRLDSNLTGIGDIVRGALHHFDKTVAEAAESLYNRIKVYGGIAHKNYAEELAAVANLLQDFNGDYASKVALIDGLSAWIAELTAAAANLQTLIEERIAEKAAQPQERMKDIRREIDSVFIDLIDRINAVIILESPPNFLAFANELNEQFDSFNKIYSHKRKDNDTQDNNEQNEKTEEN
ncbi:MAG: DUF6261 family protein [Planctomycetaceae bacterium]|nr:DUF6261 family protein [Planctomycetaceae bacterium]